ncbi:MAG: YbbR-like domain-containing protein [Longimicrobiales bacterium]|nr:YbbR-like domain-containing protein [Longimicrobiales bacterium]
MSFLPRFVTHNASLKAAALAAAVFLWAITPADGTQRESLTSVPIRVQVADLAWMLAEPPFPEEVEVRISGPAREIIRLAREGTSVRVPVDTVFAEDTTVTLRRDWVTLAGVSGLVVEEILPATIGLTFEPVTSAALAVEIRTTGELSEDLALASPIGVTPAVVRVRGPTRILNALDSIATLPVDLSTVTASGIRSVRVDTTGLGPALLDPREVSVAFRVDTAEERTVKEAPVRLVGPGASEYRVEPRTLPMVIRGAAVRLQGADLSEVAWEIDTRALGILAVGEERRVAPDAVGVPPLLRPFVRADSVRVVRPGLFDGVEW